MQPQQRSAGSRKTVCVENVLPMSEGLWMACFKAYESVKAYEKAAARARAPSRFMPAPSFPEVNSGSRDIGGPARVQVLINGSGPAAPGPSRFMPAPSLPSVVDGPLPVSRKRKVPDVPLDGVISEVKKLAPLYSGQKWLKVFPTHLTTATWYPLETIFGNKAMARFNEHLSPHAKCDKCRYMLDRIRSPKYGKLEISPAPWVPKNFVLMGKIRCSGCPAP